MVDFMLLLTALSRNHAAFVKINTSRSCMKSMPRQVKREYAAAVGTAYLNRPTDCSRVLLKVVKVHLQYRERALETYAVFDDGSERTIHLCEAANKLGLRGIPEELALRTIRQETKVLQGASVSFSVSPASQPKQPSIHPSSTTYPKPGRGGSSLSKELQTSLFLQLLRGNPKALPGKLRDIVPPACPGSSPGPPTSGKSP